MPRFPVRGRCARGLISGSMCTVVGASKVSQGKKVWGTEAQHFLSMFPRRDPAEIRRAASNIRCQGGNRDRFRKALKRYGTYRPMVQRVLRQSGLQSDIQYLPFVESLYNPAAYSHLGAAGLWQIMPSTARGLGLRLNATVDERLDPEAATWAAARYLNNSRARLGKVAQSGVDPACVERVATGSKELSPEVATEAGGMGLTGEATPGHDNGARVQRGD